MSTSGGLLSTAPTDCLNSARRTTLFLQKLQITKVKSLYIDDSKDDLNNLETRLTTFGINISLQNFKNQ